MSRLFAAALVLGAASSGGAQSASRDSTLFIVRDVEMPGTTLSMSMVQAGRVDGAEPVRAVTREQGSVMMALDSGEYVVTIRRIGYQELSLSLRARPGCSQRVEAYLLANAIDREMELGRPGRLWPHVVITTCPPPR
jgi:hypothetical protein